MDFSGFIKTVAPWIGTALGGPLGGMAVEAASNALGISAKTTDDLKKALAGATPQDMLALKQADEAFAAHMQEIGFAHVEDIDKLANEDRNSARQREMTVRDNTPKILAYGVTLGFFGVLWAIMAHAVPAESRDVLNLMLGALGTAWTCVIAYYFGSSSGSDRKTELLAQSTPPQ